MNTRVKNEIETIGNMAIDKLYEQDDFDIANDPEFGGTDASILVKFTYKCCEVNVSVYYHAHRKTEKYVELFPQNDDHMLELLEKAVGKYVDKNLHTWELLENMREKVREAQEDEWEAHGFLDEADYIHWRYGR